MSMRMLQGECEGVMSCQSSYCALCPYFKKHFPCHLQGHTPLSSDAPCSTPPSWEDAIHHCSYLSPALAALEDTSQKQEAAMAQPEQGRAVPGGEGCHGFEAVGVADHLV